MSLRLEPLEPRIMLDASPFIQAINADHENFRFLAGDDVDSVLNTYHATVGGDVSAVTFEVGGMTYTDTDGGDGWAATFDMSDASDTNPLEVTAVGTNPTQTDTESYAVDILMLPDWMYDTGVEFDSSHDWSQGYSFDVTVEHFGPNVTIGGISGGFYTPSTWEFSIPGIDEPVFSLANKYTGFDIESTFTLASDAFGFVSVENYQIEAAAYILDEQIYEGSYSPSTSNQMSYERDFGPVHVEGQISWGGGFNPHFNSSLAFDGVSGTFWIDPDLQATIPLGSARVPLLSVPGIADLVFSADAEVGFLKAHGSDHLIEVTPYASTSGFGLQSFELNPALNVGITGSAEIQLFLGGATAGASLTGLLHQGLSAHYNDVSGWDLSAPGDFTVSAAGYYETLWGIGLSDSMDLFEWEVASWDFINQGDDPINDPNHDSHDSPPLDLNDNHSSYDGLRLSQTGEDLYRFYLQGEADEGAEVSIHSNTPNALSLQVLDGEFNPVGTLTSPDSFTRVCDIAGLPRGLYYILIFSPLNEGGIEYDLSLNIPNTGAEPSVVLVVDRSGSMGGNKINDAKNAAGLFVRLMNEGDKIGIASYSSSASVDFPLTQIAASAVPDILWEDSMDSTNNWSAESPWGLTSDTSHSGGICLTDSPSGNYGNNADSSLTMSNTIGLPAGETSSLSFWTRYDLESGYDYGRVEISANSGPWTQIGSLNGTQSDWTKKSYSLAGYEGQQIKVRFRLTTDYSVTRDGWYVDDVTIASGVVGDTKQAAIDAIESINAGGSTSIGAGVQAADGELDRFPDDPARAMIVMTDGQHNTSPDPIDVINDQVDNDIRIYTIGFGANADTNRLTEMANLRNGMYYFAAGEGELQQIYAQLMGTAGGMQQVLNEFSVIYPNDEHGYSIYIDPSISRTTVGVNWPGSNLDLELVAPDGTVVTHATAASNPNVELVESGTYEFFKLTTPMPGNWQFKVLGIDVDAGGEAYNIYAMVSSAVTANLQTDGANYTTGDGVEIQLELGDGAPILGASAEVDVALPPGAPYQHEQLSLYDDGLHNDGGANDGVYGNTFFSTWWPGTYTLQVEAEGTNHAGFEFVRTPSGQFQVNQGSFLEVAIGDGHAQTARYVDGDGTSVIVTHKTGEAVIRFVGDNLQQNDTGRMVQVSGDNIQIATITLANTTERSSLSFRTDKGGDGLGRVFEITGDGPLAKIAGRTVDIVGGGIYMTGSGYVSSVQLHNVRNGADIVMEGTGARKGITLKLGQIVDPGTDIDLASGLKSLTAISWPGSGLTAPWASNIQIKGDRRTGTPGDLGADIHLNGQDAKGITLGKLSVAGTMTSAIDLNDGVANSITAGAWTGGSLNASWLKSISIKGDRRAGLDGDLGSAITLTGADPRRGGAFNSIRAAGTITSDINLEQGFGGTVTAGAWTGGSLNAPWLKSVSIKGDKRAGLSGDLGVDITLSGKDPKKGISLGKLSVAGEIQDSIIKLDYDEVAGVADGLAGSITAGAWDGGGLWAKSVKSVSIKGYKAPNGAKIDGALANVEFNLERDAKNVGLGKLSVKGDISDSQFIVSGDVKALSAQKLLDSNLYLGYEPNGADWGDGTFSDAYAIGSLRLSGVRGTDDSCLVASTVAAAYVKNASLAYVDGSNGDDNFGFIIDDPSSKIKVKDPNWQWVRPFTAPGEIAKDGFGDFWVWDL